MEKFCISLEQAKKLYEFGYHPSIEDTESQFWWVIYSGMEPLLTEHRSLLNDAEVKYPAYHVGELGEILKDWIEDIGHTSSKENPWEILNLNIRGSFYDSEAKARGAYLIYLLEKKII